jgi:hypothetical protein
MLARYRLIPKTVTGDFKWREAGSEQAVNLKLTQKELVSISELCTSPPGR